MNINDFKRLKKLMMMTMSGADQEILTAMKNATEIVARSGETWNSILDKVVKVELPFESVTDAAAKSGVASDEEAAIRARARAEFVKKVDAAFVAIEESDPRGDFADFISDVKDTWTKRRTLSPAQRDAVFASARKTGRWAYE